MNNIDGPSSSNNPFIQGQNEIRRKQETEISEAESKEEATAFDVVKRVFAKLPSNANLSPAQLNEKVRRTLTDLSNDDPNVLNTLPYRGSFPTFYKNIDLLVEQYKKIHDVNSSSKPSKKDSELRTIAQELVTLGDYDKSLEVTKTISKESSQSVALQSISKAYVDISDLDRATEIAKLIPKQNIRIRSFQSICHAYVITGRGAEAITLSNKFSDPLERSVILQTISLALVEMNETEDAGKAFKIAKQNIDLAIEKASKLPDDDILKQDAFEKIVKALLENKDVKKAIEITSSHPELHVDSLNEEISRHWARSGSITDALVFANKIEDINTKERALSYLVQGNVEPDNFQKCLEIARSISIETHRKLALTSIVDAMLEIGISSGDDQAIAKVNEIIDCETDITIKEALQEVYDRYHPE